VTGPVGSALDAAHSLATMAARGLLAPGRPDRVARQLLALRRWGFGIAAETRSAAAREPHRAAVIDPDGSLTYRELLSIATERALRWRDEGVGPGTRIGLLRRNGRDFIIDLVAVGLLGADMVLVNTSLSGAHIDAIVAEHRLSRLIHDDEFGTIRPTLASIPALPPRPAAAPAVPPAWMPAQRLASSRPLAPPERDGRTIVLTSGTTGTPKGALRPATPGLGPLISVISKIPLRVGSRVLISAPIFHTWGLASLQLALAMRATIVLRPRFDAADAVDTLVRERCDALFAVPVMLSRMLDEPHRSTRLRVAAVSGSALPGDLAHRFMDAYGDVLYNLYGSTEASWVSIATPADLRRDPATAGRPPRGTVVAILDPEGKPAERGGIYVDNDMLFKGYTNAADRDRREGKLSTGDIGHFGEDGLLYVDGRADDMIISGGENVYPSAVERVLASVPGVDDVVVVGVSDADFGQRLAAWIVRLPGATLTADDIRAAVRAHLAGFCVPRDVRFIDELPRNATGKVVTRDLPGR
jgi:acyl-CoA synthetase (AMP-forming)/AMP-acid ligase II